MGDLVSKDAQENPKTFWSYIKSKKQESSGVAPLKNKDSFLHSGIFFTEQTVCVSLHKKRQF